MARRRGRTVIPLHPASSKQVEARDMSDKEKLQWQQFLGPYQQVIAGAQQALQAFASVLLADAGLSADDGWVLDSDRMKWVRLPRQKG
jgi:hypothetical protein